MIDEVVPETEEELIQDEDYVDLVVDMIELQDDTENENNSDLDDEIALLNSLGF